MWLAGQGEGLDVELLDQSLCVMIIFIVPESVPRGSWVNLHPSRLCYKPHLSCRLPKPFWNNQQQGQLLCRFFYFEIRVLRFASIHAFESPLLPARSLPSWSWLEDLLGFGLLSVTLVCHFHKQVFGEQNS